MKMFNEETEKQLQEIFDKMVGDVTIALFTTDNCVSCPETKQYMEEITSLSDKIHFINYDINQDKEKAAAYHVEMVPSIVLLDTQGDYKRIKFNGIPAGYEVNSFIMALLEVSGVNSELPQDLADRIEAIKKPVNIKVFITLSCPHCAGAVQKSHKMAFMNSNIEAEMIEAQTFSELSSRFNVSAVPKIVINDKYELLGNQPIQAFLNTIESI